MTNSVKDKTVNGLKWSAIERFSLQIVQFVIQLIMARLLLPSDYGIVAVLSVFIQVSQVFIDGGFTDALIQKKDRNNVDFSTVFYVNVSISILFYFLLFVSSPFLARFYHMPLLESTTKIMGLTLIISSLSAVHKTILTCNVDFKTQSKISLLASGFSGFVGISMAYCGCGVWALVGQMLLNSLIVTIMFYVLLRWVPLRVFSKESFKHLFSFGSKLLFAKLIHMVYYNLYTLVIGRKFTPKDLGCFTRAEQFAMFPTLNINSIIQRVTYPILSEMQDDNERLSTTYSKYIQVSSLLIFPLMVGLCVLAKPLILLLLTDKWEGIIILLQILCFDWMFDHLSMINLNLLFVKGHSDYALRLEIIKKTIATTILVISIPFGIYGMCVGKVIYSVLAIFINSHYTYQLIQLRFIDQLKDFCPFFFMAMVMGGVVVLCISFITTLWIQLLVGTFCGAVVYMLLLLMFKRELISSLLKIFNRK